MPAPGEAETASQSDTPASDAQHADKTEPSPDTPASVTQQADKTEPSSDTPASVTEHTDKTEPSSDPEVPSETPEAGDAPETSKDVEAPGPDTCSPSTPHLARTPSGSTVNVVSILSSANRGREARSKRRVTFAEEIIDAAFSPDPPMDDYPDEEEEEEERHFAEDELDAEAEAKPSASAAADSTSRQEDSLGDDDDDSDELSEVDFLSKSPLARIATELLALWSSLKEIFKIPKKERVEERKRTEMELGKNRKSKIDVLSKKETSQNDPYAKWKRTTPARVPHRKRPSDDDDKKNKEPRMSKAERRQRFEAEVKAQDEAAAQAYAEEQERQREAYILHQQRLESDPDYFRFHQEQQELGLEPQFDPASGLPIAPTHDLMLDPATGQPIIDPVTGQPIIPGQEYIDPQTGQPFMDPSGMDPNSSQHMIDPNTGQPLIDPNTGQPLVDPNTGQPYIDPNTGQPFIDPNTGQQYFYPNSGPPVLEQAMGQPMLDPNTGQPVIDPATGQPIMQNYNQAAVMNPHHPGGQMMTGYEPHADSHPGLAPLNLHTQGDPAHMNQPMPTLPDFVPPTSQMSNNPLLSSHTLSSEAETEDEVPPPPSPPVKAVSKLPTDWKSAKDAEGRVYYYHAYTRQTQWELPTGEEGDNSDCDMEVDPSPSEEDIIKMKKKPTTAAADTTSENARKIKEQFRNRMSRFIVDYLSPFRKSDCKAGRITTTEDFKYLARKLTHHVMSKELKHCRHVEDLEVNENVKAKAKDFVGKYMRKFGSKYSREKDSAF